MFRVWLARAACVAVVGALSGCASAAGGPWEGDPGGGGPSQGSSGGAAGAGASGAASQGGSSGTASQGGSSGASQGGSSAGSPSVSCDDAAPRRVRRLSLREIALTLSDLLQTPSSAFAWSAPDPRVGGFDTRADLLIIESGSLDDFVDVANLAVESADVTRLAACSPGANEATCAADFLVDFARRAYGRTVSADERARLTALYAEVRAHGDHAHALRTGLTAILSSPYFLYRTELGANDAGAKAGTNTQLGAEEVANALAFAITGARPDAALLTRASSDAEFVSPDVLRTEALRLSALPRGRQQLALFLRQWLGVEDLKTVNKIPALFPDYTPALKADLDRELSLFLSHVLDAGNGTLSALFGAELAFPSQATLTTLYSWDYTNFGRPVPSTSNFAPLALQTTLRRGVLSLPGWLAAHSPVHRSSPVDRGLTIRTRLFCQSISSPPAGAVNNAPSGGDENATTREKFEKHSSEPLCQGCHRQIDPIGFGLEMMDALGRYRVTEAGRPVDSNGVLTGTDVDGPFRGPAELAEKLLASRMVRDCFVLQLFRFVNGRDAEARDACQLKRLREFFADEERSVADLMVELVLQGEFRARNYER